MDAITQLIERERICEVKARYCRMLDTKNWEGFGACFTEDGVLDVSDLTGAPPHHGRAALVAVVQASVEAAQTAHHVHSPEIWFDADTTAHVIWAMHDRVIWAPGRSPIAPVTGISGYGHYHERYVQKDGTWRIASLKLTRLMTLPDQE
jgi:hypothetical protein